MRRFYLFIILLFTICYLVLKTSVGIYASVFALQWMLPGKLVVEQVDGDLSHFKLSNLNYTDSETHVDLAVLECSWNMKALISKMVEINSIKADDLSINIKKSNKLKQANSAAGSFSFINYLKNIRVKEANFNKMKLNSPKTHLKIEVIRLLEKQPWHYVANIDLENGHIETQIALNNMAGLSWKANVAVDHLTFNYHNALFENVGFILVTSGSYDNKLRNISILANHFKGEINKSAISGAINLNYNGKLFIKLFQLKMAQASLTVSGYVDDVWNLSYDLFIPRLSKIESSLEGSVSSSGKMTGLLSSPILSSQTHIEKFNSTMVAINHLDVNVNGKIMPNSPLQMLVKKGELHFKEWSFDLPFNNFNANVIYKDNGEIDYDGKILLGKGQAYFEGKTAFNFTEGVKGYLYLTGTELFIKNRNNFNVTFSPRLTVEYKEGLVVTKGRVDIPSAKIINYKNNNVVSLSSDIVYIENKKSNSIPINMENDIEIVLGDKIEFDYDNIKAQLFGSLHMVQKPGGQLTATGIIIAKNGTYTAYGKPLNIKVGKLVYVGNYILNPGLDIEAIYTINRVGNQASFINSNSIMVGVKVSGTLNQPRLSLISNPPMSQTNILSYLLFDTPSSQLSLANTMMLMRIATSVNSGSDAHSQALDSIQEKIEELGISMGSTEIYDPSNNASTTTSTVGVNKKLNDKLTISYQASPLNNLAVFGVHYQISKYLVLRTQASNLETTADLIFEVESD